MDVIMNIVKAKPSQTEIVQHITHTTIHEIYPLYYPAEVVDFFITHHSEEKIAADIKQGKVYIVEACGSYIGTGAVDKNYIYRMFILPKHQGFGFGSLLLSSLENVISDHQTVQVDAALSALTFYEKQGYEILEWHSITVTNKKVLIYPVMKKRLP